MHRSRVPALQVHLPLLKLHPPWRQAERIGQEASGKEPEIQTQRSRLERVWYSPHLSKHADAPRLRLLLPLLCTWGRFSAPPTARFLHSLVSLCLGYNLLSLSHHQCLHVRN